ncbi:MAG: 4'-phosphopantetheinyl transferase superfamily protein [Bacteroidales bacterium]|nr:4'-phosphopantetheinyl transferase superfamily protein [Bacteroidales bacterium]
MPVIKKIYYNDAKIGLWKLSEEVDELENLILNDLSAQEKSKYNSFKSNQRKKEWLATRILLKEIKKSQFHTIILYNEACKPYTNHENISISHTRNYVAVIISQKHKVSIDIEKISNKPIKIIDKFLSENEKQNFDYKNSEIATLLWSVKETVYKFYGKKNLPFIDQINILPTNIFNQGKLTAILLNEKIINVNYFKTNSNILTFISE